MEDYGRARAGTKKPEPAAEKVGKSFFHQLIHKRMVLNGKDDPKSLLHRLVFVSKISTELADKRHLGEYWERQFHHFQDDCHGEGVTGTLLLYPSYTIHVLESSSDVLYCVLRQLRSMKASGDRALVLDPKILVMSHNIPRRLFSQWSYKVLDVPAQHLGVQYSEEATESIISECLSKLLKIGKHLTKYPKGSKNIPDSVFEKVPELIVPQASICHLLQCKELLTPEQFLQAYDAPVNILLDSDRVWPTPVHLKAVETKS
ncbi:testis-expressed protein 47-like isoform X2 [Ascaphus truei]|uniref:testis-expressed protein 47-like isoform X2 n=1 Tax=Ascaphus truei TaxID=8439 RepID=UPI003F592AB0